MQDTGSLTSWNTTLTESRVIRELGDGIKLSYQVIGIGGNSAILQSPGDC